MTVPAGFDDDGNRAGLAALTVLEALLLELEESEILSKDQIQTLLENAVETHRQAALETTDRRGHEAVATLIRRLLTDSDGSTTR